MKRFVTFITILTAICYANAQTTRPNYYMDRDTVYGQNVTYIVNEKYLNDIHVYYINNVCNTHNAYERKPLYYKNGRIADPRTSSCSYNFNNHNLRQISRALRKTFPHEKVAHMFISFHPNYFIYLAVYLTATPEGKISEVEFLIPNDPEFTSISPDSLFLFEQNIKKHVRFRKKDYNEPDTYSSYYISMLWFPFGHQKYVRMYKRYADEEWLRNAYFKIF